MHSEQHVLMPTSRTSKIQLIWLGAFLCVAAVPHLFLLPPTSRLVNPKDDVDGYMKLKGIERDPRLLTALSRFWGDDPQGVHTFRPLPAFTLWIEYRLWGFRNWPYIFVNWLWLVATGYALYLWSRAIGMPEGAALGAAGLFLALPSRGTIGTLQLVATRHDLMCVFFAVAAAICLCHYLQTSRRRKALWGYAGWSLLAYLSKEMAVALLPFTVSLAFFFWRRNKANAKEAWTAISVAACVAAIWLVLYRIAEQNMNPAPFEHSLAGWLQLLYARWPRSLRLLLLTVSIPAGHVLHMLSASPGWDLLIYPFFWKSVAALAATILAIVVLWRHQPEWLFVLYAWKITSFLPVLPYNCTWPWYEYMPHIADPLLPAGMLWLMWHIWRLSVSRCGIQAKILPLRRHLLTMAEANAGLKLFMRFLLWGPNDRAACKEDDRSRLLMN